MLEELYTENDGRAPVVGAEEASAVNAAAGAQAAVVAALSASIAPATPRMEGVPSEQLWRAAILAARQAALAAADLRRALAESAGSPIVATADDAVTAPLVS